jgi:Replication-relaxation
MVSGRRKHPTMPPPVEPLAALAGRLTAGDRQVCRLLGDHQVLTAGLLALLVGTPPRTLQQRLTTLATLKVVDRFRPHQPMGAGSAPYHYLLGEAGAAVLAADASATADRPGGDRAQLLRLAHAKGHLTHLLGVNTLVAQLTHTAPPPRRHPAGVLVARPALPGPMGSADRSRRLCPLAGPRRRGRLLPPPPPPHPPRSRPARSRSPARGLQRPGRRHRHHHPPCCCPPAIPTRKPSCASGSPASGF